MVPFWHWPVEVPHTLPTPGTLSSTTPLQSLSMPSQTSGVGPTQPLQVPLQGLRPLRHWLLGWAASWYTRPGWPGISHSVGAMPSSTVPLQLLSWPSQISACGELLQVPKPLGTPLPTQPPTGTLTPLLRHTRLPAQLVGGENPQSMSATPLSATPSQSLSQPSQISALGWQLFGQAL